MILSKQLKGWDIESTGSGNKVEFTRFPEGLVVVRLVDTVPNMRWTHWINSARASVNCPGKGCPICNIRKQQKANKEPQSPMGRRLSLQVINRNTGKLEILEQGITFFEDLKIVLQMAVEQDLQIDGVDLNIRRKGLGKDDTSYRIDLGEKYPMTEEDLKLIEENKIELNEYFKPNTPEQIVRILNGESFSEVMKESYESEDEEDEIVLE